MPPLPKSYKDSRFIRSVVSTIETHRMFQANDAVLVGVSGGADSVALIHVLLALAPRWDLKLGIAHFNHGLRPMAADSDETFVAACAGQLGLPLYIGKEDIQAFRKRRKLSPEEAARVCRYAFFEQIRREEAYIKIALGHQADDNAELVLMYLIRGSGPLGLCGMAPVNEINVVRPLLGVGRNEIMHFLAENDIRFITDSTNWQMRFARNRIRHELIPLLQKDYNPNITATVNRVAAICRAEEDWLEEIITQALTRATLSQDEGKICLSRSNLARMHRAQQRRVVRKAIGLIQGDLRRISLRHVEDALSLAGREEAVGQIDLPNGLFIDCSCDQMCIARAAAAGQGRRVRGPADHLAVYRYLVSRPVESAIQLHISETACDLEFSILNREQIDCLESAAPQIACFDLERLSFPLIVRNPRPGDRFWPLGMKGTQKISDFFINRKVSRSMRRQTALLESNGKIIWVVGYRTDHTTRIRPLTARALKVEFCLPKPQ